MSSNFVEIVCFKTFRKDRYFVKQADNFPSRLSIECKPVGGMGCK